MEDLKKQIGQTIEKEKYSKEIELLATGTFLLYLLAEIDSNSSYDYSGPLLYYFKAMELLEKNNCEKYKGKKSEFLEKFTKDKINKDYPFEKDVELTKKDLKKQIESMNNYWINQMKINTLKTDQTGNIFYEGKAAPKILDYFNKNIGDIFTYTCLLFFDSLESMDVPSFETFVEIFKINENDRNPLSHVGRKNKEDALRIKQLFIDKDDSNLPLLARLINIIESKKL